MRHCFQFVVVIGFMCGVASAADPPRPGQVPTDRDQVARILSARDHLATALRKEDPLGIETAEADVRRALGPFVGLPERLEPLNPTGIVAPRVTSEDLRTLSRRMNRLGSGSDAAQANRMELRNAAYLAIGLLALAEANVPDAAAYKRQAAIELDWLIARQASEGFFPYPVTPNAASNLKALAARMAKLYPEKVLDGYIYLDADGTQFDTGCAGYALAYGYQVLGEPRFLAAAQKAGAWALTFPLSVNWNYNAFSVWQLAKLYSVTKEQRYLRRAKEIAKLGLLPGQLDSGRWSDPHNARAVYHWIIVRGLVALLRAMPKDDPDLSLLSSKTLLAIQSRVDEMLRDGASNSESAMVALVEALEHFGSNAMWEKALSGVGARSPYAVGVLLRWQARRR
jgi:hypothetical protein